ncbi:MULTISPECIES: hydroxyisourate hydrolase [Marinobacter]|uniref:5-hydroxyisourate hydrolase n=1 Tax=Marinobacter suaedae TaxID=3057675 RepID=A0ABT8VZ10_9GAMM|nr:MULTISPECIES: hydroxyisourate hydrolase [unclassified Marinobacter]MBZ2169347.1 hydroxyisourate hydrolase [Marinobacter sp. F4216]MDO3721214.1 hydroxyisourate hydrolase [Marinobacter sp. chi1]
MTAKSPITTHILDLGSGKPATGVTVVLYRVTEAREQLVATGRTNNDGRITDWFASDLEAGQYRLRFQTGEWYQAQGLDTFFPEVNLDFQVSDTGAHYHVPLLLNQWGYSTYRGS